MGEKHVYPFEDPDEEPSSPGDTLTKRSKTRDFDQETGPSQIRSIPRYIGTYLGSGRGSIT